jgi:hypothetical protein
MRSVLRVINWCIFGAVALVIAIPIALGFIKKTVNKEPSDIQAPYEVQTSSRIYLGGKLSAVNNAPELTGYWYLQGGKYFFVKGSISFPENECGKVTVVARFDTGN